jgi:hypothetical protein
MELWILNALCIVESDDDDDDDDDADGKNNLVVCYVF